MTRLNLFQSLTCKGKTVKGVWERRVKVEGSYMFSHGENIEAYLKAVGESQIGHHYHNYKIHVHENGKMYRLSEYVGELGRVTNTMELDVLSPFRLPGEKEGMTNAGFYKILINLLMDLTGRTQLSSSLSSSAALLR